MNDREITLPGLVDMHVHLRDPGYTEAEDFDTGTKAAIAGGVVAVVDMPNNKDMPTVTLERLHQKIELAKKKSRTDIGFYFGALPNSGLQKNSQEFNELVKLFEEAGKLTLGLKLYCGITTGNEHAHDADEFRNVVAAWLTANPAGLILVHTEGYGSTKEMIDLVAGENNGRVHICHISKKSELDAVIEAKANPKLAGKVTCGITPHHLFLYEAGVEKLGWYGKMKPSLGTFENRQYLRENISSIDVVETDHAPHTKKDKEDAENGKSTCYGVPGLEAMLPLLLKGEKEGWLTLRQIINMTSVKPAEILRIVLPESKITLINDEYIFGDENIKSKCGWSPYAGLSVVGKILKVESGGRILMENEEIISEHGTGKVIVRTN